VTDANLVFVTTFSKRIARSVSGCTTAVLMAVMYRTYASRIGTSSGRTTCITFGFGAVEEGKGTVGIGPSCTTHCSPTFTTLALPTANVVATVVGAVVVVAFAGATVAVTVGAVVDVAAAVDAAVVMVAKVVKPPITAVGANVVGSDLRLLVEHDEMTAVIATNAKTARTFRPITPDHQSTEARAE
jgi:hypothetical protein